MARKRRKVVNTDDLRERMGWSRYWMTRIMETPGEKLTLALGIFIIVFLLIKLPPYQVLSLYAFPHDDSDLHNPSMSELGVFLRVNQVDKNEYVSYLYNCVSFTKDLLLDAKGRGIRGYFVIINGSNYDTNHAIAMFETTDQGAVYIEPQNDAFLNPDNFDIVYKSLI